MIDIGINIRVLREMRGLTQKELASAAGITSAALSRLERGGEFSTNKLGEIAKALNARVSDIDPRLKEDLARLEGRLASVPQRLKQARERAGYHTATVAAEALGVAYGTYSSHENGLRGIKGHDLARYAEFFRVTPDWLQFGRGTIDDLVNGGAEQTDPEAPPAPFGEATDAATRAVDAVDDDEAAETPAPRRTSEARDVDRAPSQGVDNSLLNDEVIAVFDGVLDGYGFSAERRSGLARVFADALAEPVGLPPGRDRAMARRAIARALVRALKLAEENRSPGAKGE
jgi:transcriptional regulator with XRE-family HTH domain